MITDKTKLELIKELREALPDTQLRIAVNLIKGGDFTIIHEAKIPGLIERMRRDPECQKIVAGFKDDKESVKWAGSNEAKKLWNNDESIREEFKQDFESYLAYCKAIDSGRIRTLKKGQKHEKLA